MNKPLTDSPLKTRTLLEIVVGRCNAGFPHNVQGGADLGRAIAYAKQLDALLAKYNV